MPDELTKIGLDTADIARSLDRISGMLDKQLGGASKKADKEVNKLKDSLTKLGKATAAFLGFQGISAASRSITQLNADIEATREKLVAGSDASIEFEKAIEGLGKGGVNEIKRMENALDILIFKMRTLAAKSALGWGMMFGAVDPKSVFDDKKGGKGAGQTHQDIVKAQNAIAVAESGRGSTEEERIAMLSRELSLQIKIWDYTREGAGADQEKMNSAYKRIGALTREISLAKTNFKNSEALAKTDRIHSLETLAGYKHIGEEQKIMAEFEERITNARKEGRIELERQLTQQRTIAIEDAKIARARETPSTRREARRAGRLRDRDLARDEARQREFQRRTDAGIVGQRGSPLAEFQRGIAQKPVVAGGANSMAKDISQIAKNTRASLVLEK